MNKFTLSFHNKAKEESFQKEYNTQTLYPLSQLFNFIGLATSTSRIITILISGEEKEKFIFWLVSLVYYIFSFLVLRKQKQLTHICLVTILLQVNFYLQYFTYNGDHIQSLISTFNIATINAFVIFMSDFKSSILLIVIVFGFQLSFITQNFEVQIFGLLLTYILVMMIFSVLSYWNCRQYRIKYLLSEKENLWVDLIQYVCHNPFQILTYDQINMKYNIVNSNCIDNDFIKTYNYQEKPLQNYIHSNQINPLNMKNGIIKDETVMIQQKKINLKLKITHYYMEKLYIFLQIVEDEKKIECLQNQNNLIDRTFKQMIFQLVKILPSAVRSQKNLQKLKLALMEIYLRRVDLKMKTFNVNNMIQKHIKAFNKSKMNIEFVYQSNIFLIGYQNLYSLLLLKILYSNSQIGLIRLNRDDKGTHVVFYGDIKLEKDLIIERCQRLMNVDIEIKRQLIRISQTDIQFNDDQILQEAERLFS
ncbi:hypothetical protein pb186bvf_016903 [Paramecium bursaria]